MKQQAVNSNIFSHSHKPTNSTSKPINPQTITPIRYASIIENSHILDNHEYNAHQLAKIYSELFGEETLIEVIANIQATGTSQSSKQTAIDEALASAVTSEIVRLQEIQADYTAFNKMLEKSARKGSNEQKWKIVVLTYKEKMQKYENNLKEEKRMKTLLQKQLNARIEEISRLSNLNSIRSQRLNATILDLDAKIEETNELNSKLIDMEQDLSSLKVSRDTIEQVLHTTQRQKQGIARQLLEITQSFNSVSHDLQVEREKSLLLQREKEELTIVPEAKMLTDEQEDVKREIADLKSKYQYEIIQLQLKLSNIYIEKEELQLRLLDMEQHNQLLSQPKEGTEAFTQTEENVVRASFYNSLEDDLEEEDIRSIPHHNHFQRQQQQSSGQSECEFELSIDHRSTNNHQINTPRDFYESQSDRQRAGNHLDNSFEEGNSMSNTPSRYMDTLQQLTSELAEAYQKINELTQRINLLEEENKTLKNKAKPVELAADKKKGGIFNNFFKK